MEIFLTSKNTGPSYGPDPLHVLYVGDDYNKAVEAVGEFVRYEKEFKQIGTYIPTAAPKDQVNRMVKYYMADGWWYTIVGILI